MRTISTKVMTFFALVLLWAAPAFSAGEAPKAIKFAVFPYKSPKSVIEVFGPIAARIEQRLGQKVQLVSAPDTATFLAKALDEEYDLAVPALPTYYKMLSVGYVPIAKGIPSFYGGLIVRRDSPISTVEQCKGKRIAAIGEHSYAGYIFFKNLLDQKKIDSKRAMDIQFLGKLDSVIYGVLNRQYDAGLIRLDTLDMAAFAPLKEQFRVVVRSPEVPQFPFVVRKDMDQRTRNIMREVLTSLSPERPDDLAILQSLQVKRVVDATKADYDPFYAVVKDSEYFKSH